MKELFYFSHSKLMIQVQTNFQENSVQYSSHRKLSFAEREVVERYLINNVLSKSANNFDNSTYLNYIGIDTNLERELNQVQIKNTNNDFPVNEGRIEKAVKELIAKSMSNYYFEQIGNMILEIKSLDLESFNSREFQTYSQKLEELVKAYNMYSERPTTVQQVIPKRLLSIN